MRRAAPKRIYEPLHLQSFTRTALKSGSPATIDFSVRSLPRRVALIVYITLTSLSYERAASIVEVRASGLMLG